MSRAAGGHAQSYDRGTRRYNFLKGARGEEWLVRQAAIIVAKASSFIASSLVDKRGFGVTTI